MKVNSSKKALRVKLQKAATSTGGVSNSKSMMLTLITVILSTLSLVQMREETAMTTRKTTEPSADAEGKYLMPALVAMYMGSVGSDIQLSNDRQGIMSDKTPDWAKSLQDRIITKVEETKTEVTSKVENLGKEFTDFKTKTKEEISGLQSSVNVVKDSLESVNINQKKLEERVEEMERKRTTWETGVVEDMRRISERGELSAPGGGSRGGPTEDDIKRYEYEYNKMRRTVGLAPFTEEDFERIRLHLVKHAVPTTKENILSASLMDFWGADLGIDSAGIELLSGLMETCWHADMPKRKNDPDGQMAIYARFKDETGRLTCYARAKAMNEMCKKKEIEPRRVLMDICPQLERRFGCLNKLQHKFRYETEAEEGGKTLTRIEMEGNTINIQYRFGENELWRTLDAEKHFSKVPIPGIRYDDKVHFAHRPKAYKFQGVKTLPGRCRKNLPIRNPERNPARNPPIMRLNNNSESANNNTAAEASEAAALRSTSNAEKNAADIPVVITLPKSRAALSGHLLDLDGLDPMAHKAGGPFAELDETSASFVNPKKAYASMFVKPPGTTSSSSSGTSSSTSGTDTSTDSEAGSRMNKRGRSNSGEMVETPRSKKVTTSKTKVTKSNDIRKLLQRVAAKAAEGDAKDDDPEDHEDDGDLFDDDCVTVHVNPKDKFSMDDLGTPGKRD